MSLNIPSETFQLYVTHVEAEGPLLKIWGQSNKEEASRIETIIHQMSVHFDHGIGSVAPDTLLIANTICCAYHEDGYYRARICRVLQPTNTVLVQFIDYGNVESVPFSKIRLHNDTTEGIRLQTLPGVANDFTLSDVLPFNHQWDPRMVDYIKNSLRYHEWPACVVSIEAKKRWLNLYYQGRRYCDHLIYSKMAVPAQRCEMIEIIKSSPTMNHHHHHVQNQLAKPRNQLPNNTNNNNNNNTWRQSESATSSNKTTTTTTTTVIEKSSSIQPQLVFTSRIIDKSNQVYVTVSHVDDGPLKFSIQLKETHDELLNLMKKISNYQAKPLSEPPDAPGTVCLGKHSKEHVLRRAVIMAVIDSLEAKVFYIDYGDNEKLSHSDIYELPAEFINPPPFSLRFTLSDVRNLIVDQQVKDYFSQIVRNKTLLLHVRPREDSTLIQYCCLYDQNGKSILDMIIDKFPDSINTWPEAITLRQSSRENVHVSYVEGCSKFYVQLDKMSKHLEEITKDVAESIKTSPNVKPEQIKIGAKFLAQCTADSQWYRAKITSVQNNNNQVTVQYVDYGNDETLPITSLRSLLFKSKSTKIPALAIPCILSGYESAPFNEEVDYKFEELVLDKPLSVEVIEERANKSNIVNLYDISTMPIVLISPMLKITTSTTTTTEVLSTASTNGDTTTLTASTTPTATVPVVASTEFAVPAPVMTASPGRGGRVQSYENDLNKSFENTPADIPKKSWKDEQNEQQKKPFNQQKQWQSGGQGRQGQEQQTDDRRGRRDSWDKQGQNDGANDRRNSWSKSSDRQGQYDNNNRGRKDSWNKSSQRQTDGAKDTWNKSADRSSSDKDSDTSSMSGSGGGRRGQYEQRNNNFNQKDQRREPRRSNDFSDKQNNQNNTSWDSDSSSKQQSRNQSPRNNYNNSPKEFNTSSPREYNNQRNNNINTINNQEFKIPPPNITLGAIKNCLIVFVTNPSNFYLQLCPDNLELDNLMEKIGKIYETGGTKLSKSSMKIDTNCIAQYSEDLRWYRGVIKKLEASGALIEFIDYGNTEVVNYNNIKEIQQDISKLSTQAVHCKLLGPIINSNWNNTDIDKFSALVEEEALEAEFVGKDEQTGVYEILLKRVVNGVPSSSYINSEYAPGVDLLKAKEMLKNKNRSVPSRQTMTPAISSTNNYASFDDKWLQREVVLSSTEKVFISWYENPTTFFVQALTSEKQFRPMMNELQLAYVNKKPINESNLTAGTPVIAIYKSDGALYRADIVKSNGANGYIVKYIDFGNEGAVQKNQIFKVDKKFMTLPRQAVKCCLDLIPSQNDKVWSKQSIEQIEKILDVEQLECTYVKENSNNIFVVSLVNKGVDLIKEIIKKGFGILPLPPVPTKPDIIESLPMVHENIDINLLVGQTLRVNVSSFESTARFFIQLPSATISQKAIESFMANKDPKVMKKLSVREVTHLGAGCLVQIDKEWQRAVVIDCSQQSGFNVRLIDTGEYQKIPVNCMLALPNQLAVMQNQAVECFIKNAQTSNAENQKLKGLIEKKHVIIYIEEIQNNGKLVVKLYDNMGKKIKTAMNEKDEVISSVCQLPILNIANNVIVTHVEHSKSIWIKKCCDADTDAILLQELYDYYSTLKGTPLYPAIGKLCAGLSIDANWYRAIVREINDNGAIVQFIDYGNYEQLHPDALYELEPRFYVIPQLAIKVGISVLVRGTEYEQKKILEPYLLEKEFIASLYNIHNNWIMEMEITPGEKLSTILKRLELVVEETVAPVVDPNEPKDIINGGKYIVTVTHVDNPTQFWVQRLKDIACIDRLQGDLQNLSNGFKSIIGIPEENLICAAVYSVDEQWYRAQVIDADEEIVTVRFIDFGNTDVISNVNNNKIKQLPGAFKSVPKYAIKCRLDLSPIDQYDWSETVCQRFDALVTSYEYLNAIVIDNTNPIKIQLLSGTRDLGDVLIKENLAIKMDNQNEYVDEIIERVLDPKSAFVSHINSPSEFWIQQEKYVPDLELIADRFVVADMFPVLNKINQGTLCVAKFPDDGMWYRAKVLSTSSPSGINVIYIDYGNSAISTEIREIPNDVASIPPLSRKCSLLLPSGYDKWSDKSREEFIKLSGDGATVFHLEIINENKDTSIVKLTIDNKDITDDLIKYCDKSSPIVKDRPAPIGEEKLCESVYVTHAISPGLFWVQAENKVPDIDMMLNNLVKASDFMRLNKLESGVICAAKYPEDDTWYRAQIVTHTSIDAEVHFIDYGNSCVANQFRLLPDKLKNVPPLSRQCGLKLPANIKNWSQEACDKFFELIDGQTFFNCQQLDQNYVRLSLDDQDVSNILLPLCSKTPIFIPTTISDMNDVQNLSNNTSGVGASAVSESSYTLNTSHELSVDDIVGLYKAPPLSGNSVESENYNVLEKTFPDIDELPCSPMPEQMRREIIGCDDPTLSPGFEISTPKIIDPPDTKIIDESEIIIPDIETQTLDDEMCDCIEEVVLSPSIPSPVVSEGEVSPKYPFDNDEEFVNEVEINDSPEAIIIPDVINEEIHEYKLAEEDNDVVELVEQSNVTTDDNIMISDIADEVIVKDESNALIIIDELTDVESEYSPPCPLVIDTETDLKKAAIDTSDISVEDVTLEVITSEISPE
ncbi:hypothetical protein HCN44_005727 [Aphidius gifuensis]|uniref:Tudor domain-containing protein n=1 Tax=Aphidius gifuensis TaxID=684658 RepID=A0A834XVK6_APHGI|nr:tudor domain-containing 6 isoform X2 [Aphidius gifuensis]KAF7992946.1 hypothetical protein HCN44_005727 [Aphidius gifuensis]